MTASGVFALAMLGFAGFASPAAALAGHTIVVTTTIQAAVDAAQPGDTILVPPGTYRESVLVDKSHLTIVGSPAAIIDSAGFRTGIRVGTGRISRDRPVPACPPRGVPETGQWSCCAFVVVDQAAEDIAAMDLFGGWRSRRYALAGDHSGADRSRLRWGR